MDPGNDEADEYAAGGQQEELADGAGDGGCVSAGNNADGETDGEQATRIVDEAFAFEYVHNAGRDAEFSGNAGGGERVSCRDDGAEDQAGFPGELREEIMTGEANTDDGEGDQAKGKHEDADEVLAEITPGCIVRRGKDERRQHDEEDEIRVEGDFRDWRKKTQDQAAEHENNRIRLTDAAGKNGQTHDEQQQ